MFADLVNYVRTAMNLVEIEVNGRYAVETYEDSHGQVKIDVWDRQARAVHRPGLETVYKTKDGE